MKDKATIKKLKNEDVLIYKSDKTNRLIALNSSSYKERFQEAIGKTKETKKIFHSARYPGRILKLLENSRSSDPLPKLPYRLPKIIKMDL